jgi:hypothetical protein
MKIKNKKFHFNFDFRASYQSGDITFLLEIFENGDGIWIPHFIILKLDFFLF